jgi:hypothetical protein
MDSYKIAQKLINNIHINNTDLSNDSDIKWAIKCSLISEVTKYDNVKKTIKNMYANINENVINDYLNNNYTRIYNDVYNVI